MSIWMWIGVVLGGLLLLALICLGVLLVVGRRMEFDFDFGDAFDISFAPEEFRSTSHLPMCSRVSGTFVRWHRPEFYFRGAEFWKTFQDGPWKWDEAQRYAGKGENCGHYFALTEAGARAEAQFYGMDFSRYGLLSADLESSDILDLTYEQNLVELARRAFSNWQKISDRHFLVTILTFLIDPSKGGTQLTDFIGHWAFREGYGGILFFGARAIRQQPGLHAYITTGADDGMAGPIVHEYFRRMRRDKDLVNLVLFSGARLTSLIRSSRLAAEPPDTNPFHGASAATIDALLQYNADYQQERAGEGLYLAQPFTVE